MKHIILASASVLAMTTGSVFAQAAPADGENGIADIIVTAQRVEESAQKAPLAIAVVKPEDIIRQNITRAEDLMRVVPALVTTANGGPNTSFFLRGVGNTTVNSYSDPAISFNYDGVYIGRPNSTQGFFYDLERVEVLKGPQGTLYGRNATGGAINVIPARPRLGQTGGEASLSYGNYDAIQGRAAFNVGLGENAALRVAGAVNKRDGYLSDGTSDQDEFAVRAQLLVELTPDLTNRIGVDYSHQGGAGTGTFIYGTFALNTPTPTPTSFFVFTPTPQLGSKVGVHDPVSEAFVQTRFIGQAGRTSEAVGTYPSQDNEVYGITNETNWTTGLGTLTVQAGYRESNIKSLGTSSNFRGVRIDEHAQQATLEARFAGKIGDSLDFLVGGFIFDEDIATDTSINQLTTLPIQNYKTGTSSKAVFGRVAFHVTSDLTLTGGIRYTDDSKYMNGLSNVFTLFCGSPAPPQDFCDGRTINGVVSPVAPLMPLLFTAPEVIAFYAARGIPVGPPGSRGANRATINNTMIAINSVLSTKKTTYRLAADWEITPRNLLYASFETGFHGGGFNFGRGREIYRPETIKAFTIGSKNRFFDNRVQLNIEGFYWKYKDQQISQFGTDFSTPPISVFYTDNIGRSTIKGVDVDLDVLVTPTTRLSGSVQYLKNQYDSYTVFTAQPNIPNFACPFTAVTSIPATPLAPAINGSFFRIDCSGRQGLFSPKWSFSINAEQTIELGGFKLVAQAGTRWRGDYFAATSYQPWTVSQAAFASDASLTLAPDSDRWFLTAYVNNIENTRRLTQSNINNSLSTQSGVATAPRTYGIRAGAKF